MQSIWDIAWHRFNLIQTIVSDATARLISVLFYFTILPLFGIGYALTADPFNQKQGADGKQLARAWHEREAIPTDLDSAKRQG